MSNDSKKTRFPEYIYPPPLLDSLGLMSRLLEEEPGHWNGIWEECNRLLNSASAKAPIYSMPCLVGESIKEILLFADKLCWNTPEYSVITINDDTDQSTEDLYDFPTLCNSSAMPISLCFAYNAHKDRYEARRFCPIFISRPAHKKFDNSVSFVVCVYTIAAKKSALKEFYFDKAANRFPNRDDEGRRMLSLFEIKSIRWMGVQSLRKTDLYEAADKLSMEVNVLRELFRQQTYQLYGVVPSFLHSVKGRSCPQENDQRGWDGGDVTVSVHPHTANWWTLAQNYQYRALAPHKNIGRVPHEFPFPNKHFYYDLDDPDWEAIDEFYGDHAGFSTHWKAKLICELDRGAANLETLVRYHFFDAEAKRPRCSFTIKAAADIAPFLHADQYQCAELTHVPFENYQFSIPPVEFPLRLLRQNREQHDLLTQTYTSIYDRWLMYAARNQSCAFFVAALLYAAHPSLFPIKIAQTAVGSQVLQIIENQAALVVKDAEILKQRPDHPLCRCHDLWHTKHVSAKASPSRIASGLKKVRNKLVILIFDGPTRQLSVNEYEQLLCAAPLILLANVSPPEGYRTIPISVKDLEQPDPGEFEPAAFPCDENFGGLKFLVDHALARLTWYAAYDKLLRVNMNAHKDFCTDSACDSIEFAYKFRAKMACNRLRPNQTLLLIREMVEARCPSASQKKKQAPYLPFLISLYLLFFSDFLTSDTDSCGRPLLDGAAHKKSALATSLRHVEGAQPAAMPTARERKRLLDNAYPDFLFMLRRIRENTAPNYCRSKEEYLQVKKSGKMSIGWESNGIMYLDYTLFWDVFCHMKPAYQALSSKKLYFLKNILAPAAGSYLHRDDAKSGHWACRYTVFKDGKRQRIGSFLVLDSALCKTENQEAAEQTHV